jgi:hypothetical protein
MGCTIPSCDGFTELPDPAIEYPRGGKNGARVPFCTRPPPTYTQVSQTQYQSKVSPSASTFHSEHHPIAKKDKNTAQSLPVDPSAKHCTDGDAVVDGLKMEISSLTAQLYEKDQKSFWTKERY